MSRSGYSDECENLELYRANVDRALRGRRGHEFLKELAASLDAMPDKCLIAGELVAESGECCALGAVCKSRSLDVSRVDYEDPGSVARALGVTRMVAAETAYMNDEHFGRDETPEQRWARMREWVSSNLPNEIQA